jgi:hypothetical protein
MLRAPPAPRRPTATRPQRPRPRRPRPRRPRPGARGSAPATTVPACAQAHAAVRLLRQRPPQDPGDGRRAPAPRLPRRPSPVFDGLYVDVGIDLVVSPSTVGPRVQVEWMPIAPLVLKLNHSALWYTAFPRGWGTGCRSRRPARTSASRSSRIARARGSRSGPSDTSASLTLRAKVWRLAGRTRRSWPAGGNTRAARGLVR